MVGVPRGRVHLGETGRVRASQKALSRTKAVRIHSDRRISETIAQMVSSIEMGSDREKTPRWAVGQEGVLVSLYTLSHPPSGLFSRPSGPPESSTTDTGHIYVWQPSIAKFLGPPL